MAQEPKMRIKREVTDTSIREERIELSRNQLEYLIAKAIGLKTTIRSEFDWSSDARVVVTTRITTKDNQEDDEFHV